MDAGWHERKERVTIAVSLRYHVQSSTYYIQIRGIQYDRLNKKIKRVLTQMEHIRDNRHSNELLHLEEHRRRLVKERQQSQCYVKIDLSDIPDDVSARPIYKLQGQIVTVEPEQYARLLDRLHLKSRGDEN